MRTLSKVTAVLAVGAAMSGFADVETVSSAQVTFKLFLNEDATYALSSLEDFATWPVTWRKGETVTAEEANGTVSTLVSDAVAADSQSLAHKGGVWMLTNSAEGTARVGVPWTVFDDSFTRSSAATTSRIDTMLPGPDRKLKKSETPPVAYSGDDWAGDLSKASTITFTPPEGSGLEATTWNKTGSSAAAFTFNAKGVWTVTLTFADNTTRTAHINIQTAGFVLIVK